MLHNITLQRLYNLKHSNLLVQFVSYKENEDHKIIVRSLVNSKPNPFLRDYRIFKLSLFSQLQLGREISQTFRYF